MRLLLDLFNLFRDFELKFQFYFQQPSEGAFHELNTSVQRLRAGLTAIDQWNRSVIEEIFS